MNVEQIAELVAKHLDTEQAFELIVMIEKKMSDGELLEMLKEHFYNTWVEKELASEGINAVADLVNHLGYK